MCIEKYIVAWGSRWLMISATATALDIDWHFFKYLGNCGAVRG